MSESTTVADLKIVSAESIAATARAQREMDATRSGQA